MGFASTLGRRRRDRLSDGYRSSAGSRFRSKKVAPAGDRMAIAKLLGRRRDATAGKVDIERRMGRISRGSLFCFGTFCPPPSRLLDADQAASADLHKLWPEATANEVIKLAI